MGQVWSASAPKPDTTNPPTFDPLLGFPNGRKERVMIATEEEMQSAKIPKEDRDYCAHLLLQFKGCRAEKWPLVYRCAHEKHAWQTCQYEDFVLRMKEHERERRLLARQAKKKANQIDEEMSE